MQVILEEARESYRPEVVREVVSDTVEDMERNVRDVLWWVQQWLQERAA